MLVGRNLGKVGRKCGTGMPPDEMRAENRTRNTRVARTASH